MNLNHKLQDDVYTCTKSPTLAPLGFEFGVKSGFGGSVFSKKSVLWDLIAKMIYLVRQKKGKAVQLISVTLREVYCSKTEEKCCYTEKLRLRFHVLTKTLNFENDHEIPFWILVRIAILNVLREWSWRDKGTSISVQLMSHEEAFQLRLRYSLSPWSMQYSFSFPGTRSGLISGGPLLPTHWACKNWITKKSTRSTTNGTQTTKEP